MGGDLAELVLFMLFIACVAFAPLAYFIYMYTMKNGEPFGDTEPHGDSESAVLNMATKVISLVKGKVAK